MQEIRISVRNLVEFILRSGDIDNRKGHVRENAMQEGGRIHRMLQRRMGSNYHAEVSLRYVQEWESYRLLVEGRADGIILESGDVRAVPELSVPHLPPAFSDLVTVTIDEIKGTYRDLQKLKEANALHLAQAKCYAAIYGIQNGLKAIRVRITYCHMETEELRYFHHEYDMEELSQWFLQLLASYRKWADFQFQWKEQRTQSIQALSFPYAYRDGQKDLATYVYRTIYHKKKLFIEAPTGAGKTIATVFPAVKAIGEGLSDKLFYLTAKTITASVAENALQLMREKGLQFKSVTLTAKDKICFLDETECNPEACPYAKGHFDRINDALYDMLTHSDNMNRESILEYAQRYQVCPFEFCLDLSLFADAVIGDYNYLFDPHVYLKRFFSEESSDYLFLVDEAHNLVDRGREMYSATLVKEDFLSMKHICKEKDVKRTEKICYHLERCNKEMLAKKRECVDYSYETSAGIAPFVRALERLSAAIEDYRDEYEESPIRAELMEFYFKVSHFLMIHENLDQNYEIYTQMNADGMFFMKLFCVDPGRNLRECMKKGRSTILFSATLLPIGYYKRLLGAEDGDYEVYATSVFRPEKKGLFLATDVTSRYKRRSESEYEKIAAYIHSITAQRKGNYMVFFPSYVFMQHVYETYAAQFMDAGKTECIIQEERMDEESREAFLRRFMKRDDQQHRPSLSMLSELLHITVEEDGDDIDSDYCDVNLTRSLVGFCVLGGIFSEGIDLKGEGLIGAIIVGTGLPLVCNEREILKNHFEENGEDGFSYAYRYPGMNKVLQAAGRVIRTAEDVGIIALLDDRFLLSAYQGMFPREWKTYERVSLQTIEEKIRKFWESTHQI